jgi:hypothetical protein
MALLVSRTDRSCARILAYCRDEWFGRLRGSWPIAGLGWQPLAASMDGCCHAAGSGAVGAGCR